MREYDVCANRVERSTETNRFNRVLIAAIEAIPNTEQLVDDLREATPRELTLEIDCPRQPSFVRIFFSGDSDAISKYKYIEEKP